MKKVYRSLTALLLFVFVGLSCKEFQPDNLPGLQSTSQPATPENSTATPGPTRMAPVSSNQPYKVTGNFKSSGEIGGEFSDNILYSERMVILFDLHGFITRNKEWELPVESQVIGHVDYNPKDASGTYTLFLPEIPQGTFNDVDNNGRQDMGVQVFAVDYEPNLAGDPFLTGNDRLRGWPGNQASVQTTADEKGEVTGGRLIVYAPDDKQGFPSDFGLDGKLFTSDDPAAILPAGYSMIDLNTRPFTVSQKAEVSLPLLEAADVGPKDYSKDSYTQAFDHLLQFLRKEYAFSGIAGKQPDWDKLQAELGPRVEQAEKKRDAAAFYAVLRDFTYAFKDGHVGLDGGDYAKSDFQANFSGSLGFSVRVLDDKSVIVKTVLAGGAAEAAGMKVGAVITQFNEKPVLDAIKAQSLFFGNQSSDANILYTQAVTLTRIRPGGQATVGYSNPDGQKKIATLTANPEVNSLLEDLGYNKSADLVPVEMQILTANGTDIGYIKSNTNVDDLNLMVRLIERAFTKFEEKKITGIIIDLRNNSGGVPLGMAGYLTNQSIQLGQLEYYDSASGKFSSGGVPRKFSAKQPQFHFDKIAVLVGMNCASACELESYALGQLPGAVIVGQYASAGVEAEVSKGQIKMPEGIGMQFPTGRFINPDGSLFLEGQGVQPSIKVPVNATTVLSHNDVVMQAALTAVAGK